MAPARIKKAEASSELMEKNEQQRNVILQSPSRTPTQSRAKKPLIITEAQKQALIDNLQLEGTSLSTNTTKQDSRSWQSPSVRESCAPSTHSKLKACAQGSSYGSTAYQLQCEKRTWASSMRSTNKLQKPQPPKQLPPAQKPTKHRKERASKRK